MVKSNNTRFNSPVTAKMKRKRSVAPDGAPTKGRRRAEPKPAPVCTGAELQALRKEIGWSTVQVAAKVKRSEGWIRRVERDVIPVPCVMKQWLCDTVHALRSIPPPKIDG